MKICVSLNGVVADTPTAFVSLIERVLGIKVPRRSFSKDLLGKAFPNTVPGGKMKRLLDSGWEKIKSRLYNTEEFYRVSPVPGAVEAFRHFQDAGHETFIVTDAKSLSPKRLRRWLSLHGFAEDMKVIFARKGRRSKEPHHCDCDVIIDHDLERLKALPERPGIRLIHFMPERNSTGADAAVMSTDPRIQSVRGWSAVLKELLPSTEALAA